MREPTLSLPKAVLEGTIGDFLGWGVGADNGGTAWDSYTQARILEIRASGERNVYHNPPCAELGVPAAINWTFLRPVRMLDIASGQTIVPLPDDFASLDGDVLIVDPARSFLPLSRRSNVSALVSANPSRIGIPEVVELEWGFTGSAEEGQRAHLRVFPTPDTDYVIRLRYNLTPESLSGTRPYTYGGAAHAETFKASCRAAAELYRDREEGVEHKNFWRQLAKSYKIDSRNRPSNLGYCGDMSDCLGRDGYPWTDVGPTDFPTITVGGITPD